MEYAWENSLDHLLQQRVEEIVHHLQFDSIKKALKDWKLNNQSNLLEGAIITAKYQYPDLDEEEVVKFIDTLTQDVWNSWI